MNCILGSFSPPVYYLFIPGFCPYGSPSTPASPLPQEPSQNNAENIPKTEEETEKLAVTREDLLREGYEKTKKAWTEEEDALLLRLCKNENSRFDEIA
jgi:hypothetical protein